MLPFTGHPCQGLTVFEFESAGYGSGGEWSYSFNSEPSGWTPQAGQNEQANLTASPRNYFLLLLFHRHRRIDFFIPGLLTDSPAYIGEHEPRLLAAVLFGLTALISLFISNEATAVPMTPVALSAAHHLNASPYSFVIIVASAASAAFMNPISSSMNTLVLGPGQYRFNDFVKIVVPFTLLVMVISVLPEHLLFPIESLPNARDPTQFLSC
jgi:hypothetical protein